VESLALAELIAAGDRVQDLTRPTKALAQDALYRIWRNPEPVLLKVYGTAARARREAHALHALSGIDGVPQPLDGGMHDDMAWALFVDPGEWNLAQLPETRRNGTTAGKILRAVHESDPAALSNLSRGIDAEWIELDFQSTMRRLDRYRGRIGLDVDLYEAATRTKRPYASAPLGAHTDPSPMNFALNEDGDMTLTNWQWATLAPPEWDLTKAIWLASIHAGPSVAIGIQEGYGVMVDDEQLARWTVYHAAMRLVFEAEQRMFDSGPDSYEDTVGQLREAVSRAG
jgi:Phosphotransferase enzyme family